MNTSPLSKPKSFDAALLLLGALAGAYVLYLAGRYLAAPGYFDHAEPVVAQFSWEFLNGQPLYRPLADPAYRINLHGPLLALLESALFGLAGPSIAASKLVPLAATCLALLLFAWHQLRGKGAMAFDLGSLLFAGYLMLTAPIGFWNRPDPLLLLIATAGIVLAGKREDQAQGLADYLLLGILAGLAASLKLYAPIFLLPALARLLSRENAIRQALPRLMVAGLAALGVGLLPFLHPQVSLEDFLGPLKQIAGNRHRDWSDFAPVLKFALYYLLPPLLPVALRIAALRENPSKSDLLAGAGLLLALALAVFPASMPGAGPSHLLPLLPASIDLLLRQSAALGRLGPRLGWLALAYPILVAALCLPSHARHLRRLADLDRPEILAATQEILAGHPGVSIQLGFGAKPDTYRRLSVARALLGFAGHRQELDPLTLMESQASGVDLSAQAAAAFEPCPNRLWLLPRQEAPFALSNYYRPNGPVLTEALRQDFLARFRPLDQAGPFDIWACVNG